MIKSIRSQKGYFMLEVVLATLIITVALLSVSGVFINSTKANAHASASTSATGLAQKELELLSTKPPSYWAGLSLPSVLNEHEDEVNKVIFHIKTTAVACSENNNLVEVSATVSWRLPNTKSQQDVVVTTFYPKITVVS